MAERNVVVLVGHCGPDVWMLRGAISTMAASADVRVVNSDKELEAVLGEADGLLINRVLDGSFVTSSGVELIRILSARDGTPSMALVSNYADAQEEAQSAGAVLGFGKSDVHDVPMQRTLDEMIPA